MGVKGFATIDQVSLINVEGTGMVGVPGTAATIFRWVAGWLALGGWVRVSRVLAGWVLRGWGVWLAGWLMGAVFVGRLRSKAWVNAIHPPTHPTHSTYNNITVITILRLTHARAAATCCPALPAA